MLRCINERKEVRGYYSDLLLDPNLPPTHSLYPSAEHTTFPKMDGEMVVESRIVNDMKSHLSDAEFWHAIEHLFLVGVAKKKIAKPGKRRDTWSPASVVSHKRLELFFLCFAHSWSSAAGLYSLQGLFAAV